MNAILNSDLRQRADYTHKPNLKSGRHGWLRLTPAYSVRVVEEVMVKYNDRLRVFDPFCGTGTTALSAAYHGHDAATTEINPFLVWLAKAKTDHYTVSTVSHATAACRDALELVRRGKVAPLEQPPIHNIERWWPGGALVFLCSLQAAIQAVTEEGSQSRTLLNVAFCRTLISSSNAAFNHQSMSFKAIVEGVEAIIPEYLKNFEDDFAFVINGALENPEGDVAVLHQDARSLADLDVDAFDLVVTSPPYANRMSYIRELRPYMYWLRYLITAREAGELDWQAIGGTWGIATSRLKEWRPGPASYQSDELDRTLAAISGSENANGVLLATYVHKYMVDMYEHFKGLRNNLNTCASLHYIVGNSTFYGTLLSVEEYYKDMLQQLGYDQIEIRALRKRNSKKELIEFDVSARWPS